MSEMIIPKQEPEQERTAHRNSNVRKAGGGLIRAAFGCSIAALAISLGALWIAWPEEEPAQPEPVSEPEVVEAFSPVEYLTYREHQLPIDEELALNLRSPSDFTRDERGWLRCEGAVTGVDVSAHQGEIDWEQVAASGVEFAMLRVGYRGYGQEGRLMEDERFSANLRGAQDAGLDVGVYFFSQATNVWEAEEEARRLLELLEGQPLAYPVVFDWERIHHSPARTDGVEGKTITLMAEAFCGLVEQAGYIPGVYFNQDMGYLELELNRLDDYVFWLAEYDEAPEFYYHFDLWQYTSKGSVPGIKTPVDLNLCFRKFD